jgi:anaerobic selenocysteine-containing dehydrogenase
MINFVIKEDLFDRNFVENWCHGFDELRTRASEYTLEKVAGITGVPAEKISEASRVYAANRPGCMIEGMGIEHLQQNAEVLHARWILAALVNNIDIEGGEELSGPHPTILSPHELKGPSLRLPEGQTEKQILGGKFGLMNFPGSRLINKELKRVWGKLPMPIGAGHGPSLWRAILSGEPYPVKAMITTASNPMVTLANTKMVYKALTNLDLHVVHDLWLTPTAEVADYVLPAACWMEKPILWDFHGYDSHMIAGEAALPAVVPGEYEHKDEFEVSRELGIRMGQEDYWPWKTQEEYYDALLEPISMTHKEYVYKVRCEHRPLKERKYEKVGFATPTGKVELYSTIYESLGGDPLPKYEEPPETPLSDPELAKEYPLALITGGRILEFYHSEERQIESVRKRHPHPLVQLHPKTANKLGIESGDWVWIESPRGRVRQKVELFDGMDEKTVHAEHGWWYPELPGEMPWLRGAWEGNINVCTEDDPDVCNYLTGAYPLRTALCKVYKVKEY